MSPSIFTNKYNYKVQYWPTRYLIIGFLLQTLLTAYVNSWSHRHEYSFSWKRSEFPEDLLVSSKLTIDDWKAISDKLRDHLSSYDYTIMCSGNAMENADCQSALTTLSRRYFDLALKPKSNGAESRIWRVRSTGDLYGALLMLDPSAALVEIPALLRVSKEIRDECAASILGESTDEQLKYIRFLINPPRQVSASSKEAMLKQFVRETTKLFLCSEYLAGGKHTIAIFPNKLAVRHFEPFGFQKLFCGEELFQRCPNPWFRGRCLVKTRIGRQHCDGTF